MGFLSDKEAERRQLEAERPEKRSSGFSFRKLRNLFAVGGAVALGGEMVAQAQGNDVLNRTVDVAQSNRLGGDPVGIPPEDPQRAIIRKFLEENSLNTSASARLPMGPEVPAGPATNERLVPADGEPTAPEDEVEKGILAVVTNGGDPSITMINVRSERTTQVPVVEKLAVGTKIVLGVTADGGVDKANGLGGYWVRLIAKILPDGTVVKYSNDPAHPEKGAFMHTGYVKMNTEAAGKVGLRTSGEQVIVTPEAPAVASNPGGADVPVTNPVGPDAPVAVAAEPATDDRSIEQYKLSIPELVGTKTKKISYKGQEIPVAFTAEGVGKGYFDYTLKRWRLFTEAGPDVHDWTKKSKTTKYGLDQMSGSQAEAMLRDTEDWKTLQIDSTLIVVDFGKEDNASKWKGYWGSFDNGVFKLNVTGIVQTPGQKVQTFLDGSFKDFIRNIPRGKVIALDAKTGQEIEVNTQTTDPRITIKICDNSEQGYQSALGMSKSSVVNTRRVYEYVTDDFGMINVYDSETNEMTVYIFVSEKMDVFGMAVSNYILQAIEVALNPNAHPGKDGRPGGEKFGLFSITNTVAPKVSTGFVSSDSEREALQGYLKLSGPIVFD
jgi:hypothetical protein